MKKLYFSLLTFLFLVVAHAQIVNIPDANFKAKLLSASPDNQIASTQTPYTNSSDYLVVDSYNTIDSNNDGEIQESEAIAVKFLRVSSSGILSLEGIEKFSNLHILECAANGLSNLNLTNLTNLQLLDCPHNQLQSLNINGLINLRDFWCYDNNLINIDLNGLPNLKILYVSGNNLTSLNVSGLTNLRQLNCSANDLTSLDLSYLTNLLNLACNNNQLTSINANLTSLRSLDCEHNLLNSIFIKNGKVTSWVYLKVAFNPNLEYICADTNDLQFVQSSVNTAGYNLTCQVNDYCDFTPGGTSYKIQGTSKIDSNEDGCGAADSNYFNLKFNITNGINTGSLISNVSGNYSIPVQSGTHTITPQFENPAYFTVSPTSATVTFPAATSPFTQNFCITPNGVHHDLEVVVIPLEPARPGFDTFYKIKYKNKGNYNETATVNFNYNEAI
ncbi:MAG: leucine-rich repeat domain-containing protein, partial [Flavobacterium sp.]|nr:leucine-rich repeat domain-containing protein [Flavobacterium sp.]